LLTPVQTVDRLALQLSDRLEAIVAEVGDQLAGQQPAYLQALVENGDEPVEYARGTCILIIGSITQRDLVKLQAPAIRARARQRAIQGFPLETLLAVLSMQKRVVERELEHLAKATPKAAEALLIAERRLDRTIENLTLNVSLGYLDAVNERSRQQHSELEALMEVARAVNRSLEPSEVAQAGLQATMRGLSLDVGGVWLLAEEAPLALAYTIGLTWEEDRRLRLARGSARLVERAAQAIFPVVAQGPVTGFRSTVGISLRSRGELVGVMVVASRRSRMFSEADLNFLAAAAEHLALALARAEQHRLEARTDYLTGLANRPEFERAMERAVAGAERHGRPLSVLVMDLDRLKTINDTRGHHAGDVAIRTIGEVLRRVVRASDTCARLGGDEFALAMPDTDVKAADEVVRRIREALQAVHLGPDDVELELSIGVAAWEPGLDWPHLFKLADARLYREKARHRRRRAHDEAGAGAPTA
jgi:diguanylate cyclase (GGDEF)-like protein